ncbi:MAG: hypothetical protein FJW38_23870 [Acidobacteria bacterium]|nr:hypothetical protein [Acidobacteriota bacterium]
MSIEEAILEEVRELSAEKQEEALRLVRGLRQPPAVPYDDRAREMRWIRENRAAYLNKWVSIEGDRLIMADDDAMKVYQAAKAEGIRSPVVVHIVPEDELPVVGYWR